VIETAPLPGLSVPLNQLPSNLQRATGKEIQQQHALDLTDYLNNNFSGINTNQSQASGGSFGRGNVQAETGGTRGDFNYFLTGNPFNPNSSFREDPEDDTHENAVSPAAPRAVWLGLRVH